MVPVKQILNEQIVRPIKKHDWVGLRALYLLLASDVSAVSSKEVSRILRFYQNKYDEKVIQKAMEMLSRDNAIRGTFKAPDVDFARRMDKSIQFRGEGFADFVGDISKDPKYDYCKGQQT